MSYKHKIHNHGKIKHDQEFDFLIHPKTISSNKYTKKKKNISSKRQTTITELFAKQYKYIILYVK